MEWGIWDGDLMDKGTVGFEKMGRKNNGWRRRGDKEIMWFHVLCMYLNQSYLDLPLNLSTRRSIILTKLKSEYLKGKSRSSNQISHSWESKWSVPPNGYIHEKNPNTWWLAGFSVTDWRYGICFLRCG